MNRSERSCASGCAVVVLALACLASSAASEAGDATGGDVGPQLREGEIISFDQLERLRPYLPPELWPHRDFIFFEGMRMEIGPSFADYSPPEVFQTATRENAGTARIGPDESLDGYVAGEPFPMAEIDCPGDPKAGAKIAWNFDYRWQGAGPGVHGRYSYWDRGEELPLYYEAQSRIVLLAHRPEPEYADKDGDLFRGENRKSVLRVSVDAPFDAKGIAVINYRYKSADGPLKSARNDDTWVYVPSLRRVRRISSYQRTDAVSGTDFTLDDLSGFAGIVPQYTWSCLGEQDVLATVNSQVKAYPYTRDHNFGPYGLSFADDRWELRHAFKIQFEPRNDDHPYSKKVIYVDRDTAEILYSFAYDRKGDLWKMIYHNKIWSGDATDFYHGWEDVPDPRDSMNVSDIVINVQTGTGNRLEFWDASGTPIPNGKIRRLIDVGSLTRGR